MDIAPHTALGRLPACCLGSCIVAAAASACSGNAAVIGATCGPGTVEHGQQCLPDLDAAADGSGDGFGSSQDRDSGSEVGPSGDGPNQASDGVAPDGESDSGGDSCNDPALPPLWVDCSGGCAPVLDAAPGTCTAGGGDGLVCPSYSLQNVAPVILPTQDLTIRTPGLPNMACEHTCTNFTVTSAIAFKTTAEPPGTIKVPAPWHIQVWQLGTYGSSASVALPAICASAGSANGCAPTSPFSLVVVWTSDPNPPVSNIVIQSGTTCP